jgi:NADH:ubiquinone oxidoreductase subunit 5 (subunit L)/multisubunit Na+/H+ antiporter MnhA subunit
MEGPTPVSAYCIQRQWLRWNFFIVTCSFLFENNPFVPLFYSCGVLTTLLAAVGAYIKQI